jgi:hypothetical protein
MRVVTSSSYVKIKSSSCVSSKLPSSCKTVELFNVYFAGVATDVDYSTEAVRFVSQKAEGRLDEINFMPLAAFDFDINLSKVYFAWF